MTFARIFTTVPVNTILMARSNMSVIIYIGLLWWLGVMIMMQDKWAKGQQRLKATHLMLYCCYSCWFCHLTSVEYTNFWSNIEKAIKDSYLVFFEAYALIFALECISKFNKKKCCAKFFSVFPTPIGPSINDIRF